MEKRDPINQINNEFIMHQNSPHLMKLQNAHSFLRKIKLTFGDMKDGVYTQFLEIMKGLEQDKIDRKYALMKIQSLFKDHQDLIDGFNNFLPPDYQIGIDISQSQLPEFEQAKLYVKKIKNRFEKQPRIYTTFLDILRTYHIKQKTIEEVFKQVSELFANHNDLIEEFVQFLPSDPNMTISIKPDDDNDQKSGQN